MALRKEYSPEELQNAIEIVFGALSKVQQLEERVANLETLILQRIDAGDLTIKSKQPYCKPTSPWENPTLELAIEDLPMSVRLENILTSPHHKRYLGKVKTLKDLLYINPQNLIQVRGAGKRTIEQLKELQNTYKYLLGLS